MAMEFATNGGLLYHEVQESKLCAVHCLNTLLQGPFFSEVDLASIASELDQAEREVMNREGDEFCGDFLTQNSHNVSTAGDFSIQVLEKALKVWNLQVIPINSPSVSASKYDPELENAFICHSHDHWFCIRKVNCEWYNLNSLFAAPEHLSKFYLSAFLDTLKGSGWSIFVVRGNFPHEYPITSYNSFGQWLTPQDAEEMMKLTNEVWQPNAQFFDAVHAIAAFDYDLNAAIIASLMDSGLPADTGMGTSQDEDNSHVLAVDAISTDDGAGADAAYKPETLGDGKD